MVGGSEGRLATERRPRQAEEAVHLEVGARGGQGGMEGGGWVRLEKGRLKCITPAWVSKVG
jgi:hypothetical protein